MRCLHRRITRAAHLISRAAVAARYHMKKAAHWCASELAAAAQICVHGRYVGTLSQSAIQIILEGEKKMADVREKTFVLTSGAPGGGGACLIESRDASGETLGMYKGYWNAKKNMWTLYPARSYAYILMEKMVLDGRKVRDGR